METAFTSANTASPGASPSSSAAWRVTRATSGVPATSSVTSTMALSGEFGAIVDVTLDVAGTPLVARVTRQAADELGLAPGLAVFALVKAVSIDRRSVGFA